MNKVNRKKTDNFTIISNVFLRDKDLSIKAKGFLAVVMGLPDDWDFTINGICSIIKEGKTAVYNVINELKEKRYCRIESCRDEKGQMAGNDYFFYEEPYSDQPHTENPNVDNKPQLSTNIKKKAINKELNNNSSNTFDTSFVDRMYQLYPTKCPKRGCSLGKSYKDKEKIKKLLKQYTEAEIEKVIRHEIEEKYDKQYMSNFSTFLNNFPDPNCLEYEEKLDMLKENKEDKLIFDGVEYK